MMNEFQIFPDIRLVCGKVSRSGSDDLKEISCCISGICEYHIGGEYYYLTKENCIAVDHGLCGECEVSYSADYMGFSLLIEPDRENADSSELLKTPDILRDIANFESNIFAVDARLEAVISDMSCYCKEQNESMIKLKALELLMLLGEQRRMGNEQKQKIKHIGMFLCQSESEHITICQLSDIYKINQTTLKSTFKRCFGCNIYTYARNRKAFFAAELIKNSDMKVIDIAERVGYSNPSKFSSAFRKVIGISPVQYRKTTNRSA